MNLRLARIAYPVGALGPGRRLVLWTAGCPLRCPGCISPDLQPFDAGKPIAVERLANHLLAVEPVLDGITLTGGEPFAQSAALAALWKLIAPQRPLWNLLAFSGYTLPRLQRHTEAGPLLDCLDLLVAGPYRADRSSDRPLLASSNQRIHCLSPRGRAMRRQIAENTAGQADLGLLPNHRGWLIGILDPMERRRIHRVLGVSSL